MTKTVEETKPSYDTSTAVALFNEARAHTDLAHLERVKTTASIVLVEDVLAAAAAAGLEGRKLTETPEGNEYVLTGTEMNVVQIFARDTGVSIGTTLVPGLTYGAGMRVWMSATLGEDAATALAKALLRALAQPK